MVQKEPQGPPCAGKAEPKRHRRNTHHLGCLGCRQVLEDCKPQGLLMDLGKKRPGPAQINAAADEVSMGINVGCVCCLSQADTKGLPPLLSAAGVQHEIPRDAEEPGPGVILVLRSFRKPPPDYKECLRHYVLGVRRVRAALHKAQEVGVGGLVQRPKGLFPIRGSRKVAHTLYLSAT